MRSVYEIFFSYKYSSFASILQVEATSCAIFIFLIKTGFPAGWQWSHNQNPSQQILTFTSGAISSSFCPPLISNILEAQREISLKPVSV